MNKIMENKNCQNCEYFNLITDKHDGEDGLCVGECRRFIEYNEERFNVFPIIRFKKDKSKIWCGGFKENITTI